MLKTNGVLRTEQPSVSCTQTIFPWFPGSFSENCLDCWSIDCQISWFTTTELFLFMPWSLYEISNMDLGCFWHLACGVHRKCVGMFVESAVANIWSPIACLDKVVCNNEEQYLRAAGRSLDKRDGYGCQKKGLDISRSPKTMQIWIFYFCEVISLT